MIFLICCILGIILGVIIDYFAWGWDFEMLLAGFLGGALGLLAALMMWLGICCFPGSNPAIVETTSTEIYALTDNARYSNSVSGSVFLIQHKSNEKLKYSYMYLAEGKGYGFNEVDAKSCYLNYSDEIPRVIRNHIDYKNGVMRWLFPDIYEDEYIFYIPKDAEVINDFEIDFN